MKVAKNAAENLFGDMIAYVKINKIKEKCNCDDNEAKRKLLHYHFPDKQLDLTYFRGRSFMAPLKDTLKEHLT